MAALGIIGFLGVIVCIVMIIISAIKKNGKVKIWGISIAACFVLFIVGVTNSPAKSNDTVAKNPSQIEATVEKASIESTNQATTQEVNATPTATEETKADPEWINAGMYKVGSDIPAGEYILFDDGSISYFQVSKDSTGSLDSILTNDNFKGTRYVTLKEGQYVELKGAKMLQIDKAPVLGTTDGKYTEGMYKVGRDIKAGEYKVVPEGEAYMEVAKDSTGGLDSILTNDNFTAEKYVTIEEGQYIKLVGCYIIVK